MISTKEHKGSLQVGDLIWFQKDCSECYGGEDIGYVRDISEVQNIKKYKITWLKTSDNISSTEETKYSIKDMPNSYIIPVL